MPSTLSTTDVLIALTYARVGREMGPAAFTLIASLAAICERQPGMEFNKSELLSLSGGSPTIFKRALAAAVEAGWIRMTPGSCSTLNRCVVEIPFTAREAASEGRDLWL